MPPKRAATSAAASKKPATAHASYRDMIKDAIINLKERNGSSRQSIKKYVKNNNDLNNASSAVFDNQFNKAIKTGVDKGDFTQPKGASGPLKLAKKDETAKPAAKPVAKPAAKPAAKSAPKAAPAKAAPKKTATKKSDTTEKAEKPAARSTAKKATTATTKKKTATKPKANTARPRKTPTAAPAVIEKPTVTSKTKSGRVTKTTANPAPAPKRATTKKTEKK